MEFYLAKGVGLVKDVLIKANANKDVECVFMPSGFDVFNGIRELKDYSLADQRVGWVKWSAPNKKDTDGFDVT